MGHAGAIVMFAGSSFDCQIGYGSHLSPVFQNEFEELQTLGFQHYVKNTWLVFIYFTLGKLSIFCGNAPKFESSVARQDMFLF